MRILILGDFSAVNLHLWKGLTAIGYDVEFYSRGDSFKSIPSKNTFYVRKSGENRIVGAFKEVRNQINLVNQIRDYDVVLTCAQLIFHNRFNEYLMRRLRKQNKIVVTQAMACNTAYHNFVQKLAYNPCSECSKFDHRGEPCTSKEYQMPKWENEWYSCIDAIVAPGYEYYESMRQFVNSPNKVHFIPFPIELNDFPLASLTKDYPVNLFFGKNRDGFKGAFHIRPALARLKEHFGGNVNIIAPDRMPYDEYKKTIKSAHIIVDQCNSYTYGMNAAFAMAQGQVVATGAEPEALAAMGIDYPSPLINLKPDENQIYNALAEVIESGPEVIIKRGLETREIALAIHDNRKVAQQYIDLFKKLGA